MARQPVHDDLLQPTLGAEFDVTRFGRPWDPERLRYVTFFAWPLGAGALFALNYRRLGRERAARWTLAGSLLLLVLLLVAVAILAQDRAQLGDRNLVRTVRFVLVGVCIAASVAVAKDQARAFRAYTLGDGEPARLLGPAVIAIVANLVATAALLVLVLVLFLERSPK